MNIIHWQRRHGPSSLSACGAGASYRQMTKEVDPDSIFLLGWWQIAQIDHPVMLLGGWHRACEVCKTLYLAEVPPEKRPQIIWSSDTAFTVEPSDWE